MRAILISDKPKWCALMMNGDKNIEVRTSKALANAIQKLIDENGYADIYVYCTKDKKDFLVNADLIRPPFPHPRTYMLGHKDYSLNGKVIFKFRCYKVEEIGMWNYSEYGTRTLCEEHFCIKSCLNHWELKDYIKDKRAYAIHISDLEIFDKPKELCEFEYYKPTKIKKLWVRGHLTNAPQNYCYVEV